MQNNYSCNQAQADHHAAHDHTDRHKRRFALTLQKQN